MRLELAEFPVKSVRFGKRTSYNNGVLEINKGELTALALEDSRIVSADLDIAFPGEQTRVVNVRDVIEPRLKVSGPGCVFPGILGPVETVGEGKTHRLSGVTVVFSAEYRPTIMSGHGASNTAILDMWGPGAQITPFASTINVVLVLKLTDPISEWDAHTAIQMAGFKIANRLAETTRGKTPENTEVFELFKVDPSLPRVVYILGSSTQWLAPHTGVAYYGLPIRESLPTFMYPTELFDGALTADSRRGNSIFPTTWPFTNQPIILELLREHGKRLNFLGVILERLNFPIEDSKYVAATATAKMAQLLGADDAIITWLCFGNPFVDTMLTVQACVRKGIKTVLITPEHGGTEGIDLPLVFSVSEATAIVSTGGTDREIELPAPVNVIGVDRGQLVQMFPEDPPFDPWKERKAQEGWGEILGGIDWFGGMNLTCKVH